MSGPRELQRREGRVAPWAAALTSACALTGVSTWLVATHSVWLQWSVLAHLVTGVGCGLVLLVYLQLHFRRTLAIRRPTVLVSGLLTLPLVLAFVGSGAWLMLHGQRESERWVYATHVASSLAFVGLAALHVVLHAWRLPQRRREPERRLERPAGTLGVLLGVNLAVQAAIALATLAYEAAYDRVETPPVVSAYAYPYGDHPFRPSQTETASGGFVAVDQIAESHRCATCHPAVAAQWIASAHREAASDAAYVTNVSLLAEKKGIAATRYCEGCHGPVALLTGELTPGGEHAGIEGTVANREGVTCLTCHGIRSIVHLKGVGSYEFEPAAEHLFARSDDPLLRRLHDWLLRVRPDQHRRDVGRPLLGDPKVCATCHAQFMDDDVNDWGWVKMQDDYAAWLESPYSRQSDEDFSGESVTRCQDCHMPRVEADDPSADAQGRVRAHHSPGANTVLPLLRGDAAHLEATRAFLRANRMRVGIDPPKRRDTLQTLQALDESLRSAEEAPPYYYLGETAALQVTVSNVGVGHDFPGGTIDINEAWVEFRVLDAEGAPVYESGAIAPDGRVDPEAYFYYALPVDRTGRLVWRHDLFNMVGESFRRVVKAGGSDILDYRFTVPAWAKSPLVATATLKYRKLNDRYARWALKDRYRPVPVVDVAWDSLALPIRVRREVE